MSRHPKRLIAHKVWFFSEHDEEAFFEWLDKMVCIQEYHGEGKDLHITLVGTTLDDNSLRELLALFYRYDIDMPQLATFQTNGNRSWFHDPNAYWHTRVFGSNKGSPLTT
ncbi:MAG: hypothetical protein ACT4QB_22990 [Gammaproteobacteria bacterium]